MSRSGMLAATLVGTVLSSSVAFAGPARVEPGYVGDRSKNGEQETYASILMGVEAFAFAFAGPARMVGTATGNPEKDTIAYRPISIGPRDGCLSFRINE